MMIRRRWQGQSILIRQTTQWTTHESFRKSHHLDTRDTQLLHPNFFDFTVFHSTRHTANIRPTTANPIHHHRRPIRRQRSPISLPTLTIPTTLARTGKISNDTRTRAKQNNDTGIEEESAQDRERGGIMGIEARVCVAGAGTGRYGYTGASGVVVAAVLAWCGRCERRMVMRIYGTGTGR